MLRIEMLPAAHGDALWIEYGSGAAVRRLLVDAGPAHTYPALRERILHLPRAERRFELLVVTHVDADHIEGVVRLLQDADALGCDFERVWFNGRPQLDAVPDPAGAPLGAAQGEYLGLLIEDVARRRGAPLWNRDFPGPFVAVDRASGTLPVVELPGELTLTLLSPDHERLLALKDAWEDELRRAGLETGDETALRRRLEESRRLRPLGDVLGAEDEEEEDRHELPRADGADTDVALPDELGGEAEPGSDASAANGSSIALLAEHAGERVLLAGDAWPDVLARSLATLSPGRPASVTAFKVPHHGSIANVTPELLERLRSVHYLVSTSGALFRHPHERAIELLLSHHQHRARPRLHFNYHTLTTAPWADADDQAARRYVAHHPKGVTLWL